MDVSIKSFDVQMELKNKGMEIEIREPNNGARLGDLFITKSHLIWCEGKVRRENGKKVKWTDFVGIMSSMENQSNVSKKKVKKDPATSSNPE